MLGISECGILTALTLGQRFGVIAILQQSIPRHLRYVAALGVTGRLVPPRDPEAWARACLELLRDPERRRAMGAAARARAYPRYDVSTLLGTMSELYPALVAGTR